MKRVQQIRSLHISWHFAWLATGMVVGVALTAINNVVWFAQPWWPVVGVGLAVVSFTKRSRRLVILSIAAGLLLGLWRGALEQKALTHYKPYFGATVMLRGEVSDDTTTGKAGETQATLRNVSIDSQPLHGRVWISTVTRRQLKRSDTVVLQGSLKPGFGNIPASMARGRLVSMAQTSQHDYALQARDWFAGGIRRAIPEPQASLGSGFIVGQHSNLPGNLSEELRVVGLTHAVVASGSNLTILVGFSRRLLSRASKFTATMTGSIVAAGFIMITGLSPSMARAGLVTGLSLAAWYYGRRIHPLVLLPLAAAITIVWNPSYAWGDIGWQLSFGAFAGVLLLAPLLQHYFWGKDYKPNIFVEILIGTTAAQVATMPVILFAFGTFSSYALLANILVLPLIPFAMLLTFAAGVGGLAFPGLAHFAGWPAFQVMRYMTTVIHWVANLPGSQGKLVYGAPALAVSYTAMALASWFLWRATKHNFREGSDLILLGEHT